MPMNQFSFEEFLLNLLRTLRFPRMTTSVLVLGPINEGHVLSPLQAEKHIMSQAQWFESVSLFVIEGIFPDSNDFNWREYYRQTLTALMTTIDEIPQGE